MLYLADGVDIEYVDNIWLHVYHHAGMSSMLMKPSDRDNLSEYIQRIIDGEAVDEAIRLPYTFDCDPPDEGRYNLFISNAMSVLLINRLDRLELIGLVNELNGMQDHEMHP